MLTDFCSHVVEDDSLKMLITNILQVVKALFD